MSIYELAYIVARLSTYTHQEAYFELMNTLKLFANSDGACERLLNGKVGVIKWLEFSDEIARRL